MTSRLWPGFDAKDCRCPDGRWLVMPTAFKGSIEPQNHPFVLNSFRPPLRDRQQNGPIHLRPPLYTLLPLVIINYQYQRHGKNVHISMHSTVTVENLSDQSQIPGDMCSMMASLRSVSHNVIRRHDLLFPQIRTQMALSVFHPLHAFMQYPRLAHTCQTGYVLNP